MTLSTLNVSDVFQKIADQQGISIVVEGIDDVCYGLVVTADKSLVNILTQHRQPYNYQIIDGVPIRVVRRAINSDLVIDYNITQTECIVRGNGPAVTFQRVDISQLPRQVEIQYTDPDRDYATTTQIARHTAAPTTTVVATAALDFVISGTDARKMAFDMLYRAWAQQLSVVFEHGDITIEPGDVVKLTCDQGTFTVLVNEATYTKARTILVTASVLLASSEITIAPGVAYSHATGQTAVDGAAAQLTSL
jgi:hypothetical protein